MKYKVLLGLLNICCCIFTQAQEKDSLATKSNIFTFSLSKLLTKVQWDIKWFNNLFTEVRGADKSGAKSDRMQRNFFTTSLDVFTGINDSKTINFGLVLNTVPIQSMEWMHYLFLNLKTIPHNPADRE
ncbi:hypothetical protein N9483_03480 [Flavobacteriaceae bacterium]|nr:hypothetical protein [Flavobacteriaceae bacterium]